MKKKIIPIFFFILLFCALPALQSNAVITPEEAANLTTNAESNNITTPDGVYNYDGNTIEIIEQTTQTTQVLLNDTYRLDLLHNDTNLGVTCTKLDTGGTTPQADEEMFDINFEITPTGQSLDMDIPGSHIEFNHNDATPDEWDVSINEMGFSFDKSDISFGFFNGTHVFTFAENIISIIDTANSTNDLVIERAGPTAFTIASPIYGILFVDFNKDSNLLLIDWMTMMSIYGPGPIPGSTIWSIIPFLHIAFLLNAVIIEWVGVSIHIYMDCFILVYGYLILTWYFFLERYVICIWDITIIIYIAITELLLVIIYDSYEIKIYEYQIVIVYEYIEIVILFVSIFIWQFTFIFHFEFWFIQIIYIININIHIIVQPIRFIFIPVIVPVFIPVIFFVPVLIIQYIQIYVPYASPALHIDVADEDLQMPTHTIQYFVYDEAGNPVDDATVNVNYDGSVYPATFVSNGIYQVQLPASSVVETIIITAMKSWYPDAILTYDLEVDWIIDTITVPTNVTVTETETETPTAPLFIVPILSALFLMAVGTVLLSRKKKK